MGYYKIKNITNELGKRHGRVNTPQKIEFKDIIGSSTIHINPGVEITIETNYLPITAQKLRTAGLITIIEIDRETYQKQLKEQEAKNVKESVSNVKKSTEKEDKENSLKKYKTKRK